MGVTQEGEKCIFILYMEVAEEDMEGQEETVLLRYTLKLENNPTLQIHQKQV